MSDEASKETTEEVPQPSGSEAPWSADLEKKFEDEDVRKQVDEFLSDTVQPYVTKVEQEARPNRDATRLWDQLNEDPVSTSIQVVKELYGPDVADHFAKLLKDGSTPEEAAAQVEAETDIDVRPDDEEGAKGEKIQFEDLPPEVQNAIAAQQQETQRAAYYEEFDRITSEHADDLPKDEEGNPQLDPDTFHPFVLAAEGDFDAAWDGYAKWVENAKEQFGIKVPDTDDVKETAPKVINSETRDSGSTPPTKEEYGTIDEAMDAFFDEQKAPPPTVGSV